MAIARAYMCDAQLLILDEPTAALDARAEYKVFRHFRELSVGHSAVLISHRFSSVRMTDRILVLSDGRADASGTMTVCSLPAAAAMPNCSSFRLQATIDPISAVHADQSGPQNRFSVHVTDKPLFVPRANRSKRLDVGWSRRCPLTALMTALGGSRRSSLRRMPSSIDGGWADS
jgi:energy-coupling factor transporter ATP-binding protein EcfA2